MSKMKPFEKVRGLLTSCMSPGKDKMTSLVIESVDPFWFPPSSEGWLMEEDSKEYKTKALKSMALQATKISKTIADGSEQGNMAYPLTMAVLWDGVVELYEIRAKIGVHSTYVHSITPAKDQGFRPDILLLMAKEVYGHMEIIHTSRELCAALLHMNRTRKEAPDGNDSGCDQEGEPTRLPQS